MLTDKYMPAHWHNTPKQAVLHLGEMAVGCGFMLAVLEYTVVPGITRYLWDSLVYASCFPRCGWPPL